MKLFYGVINLTNKNITLSVWNKNSEKISVIQGEADSRFINLTLMDLTSPLDLTDKTVSFLAKKPDGTVIFNHAKIIDAEKGLIQVQLTSQICSIPGTLSNCEIHIINRESSTLIVKGIDIEVLQSLGETVEESISEYTAYAQLTGSLSNHISNSENPHNVTATQVNALPVDTKYGFSLSTSGTSLSLKDQDGTVLNTVSTQDTTYTAGTNISISASNIISSVDTTYTVVTEQKDGLMSSTDKNKLDGIENLANANVQSDWNQTNSNSDAYIKNKPTIPSSLIDLSGVLPLNKGGTGADSYKDAQKNLHFYTSLDQLDLTAPCTTADVLNAMPISSIFLLGTESVSASISDAPTGYGFFVIFKGANPNRKLGLFARSLSNTDDYQTGNWFYIMNTASGIYSWQKILTTISTDSGLKTTDKTIIGAINELYDKIAGL